MTAAACGDPGDEVATQGEVRFTRRGEAALDALAGRLAPQAGDTPESIARVLDRILTAEVAVLAAGLAAAAQDHGEPDAATRDHAARRRRSWHRDTPTYGGPVPSRRLDW